MPNEEQWRELEYTVKKKKKDIKPFESMQLRQRVVSGQGLFVQVHSAHGRFCSLACLASAAWF